MSAADYTRWSVILYAIAGVVSAILVVVFIRAAFAERRRKEDELEREVRERRLSQG
jgi:flagellar biosynthesis/type III secretory pathway M-ring protein FliF/YscJ